MRFQGSRRVFLRLAVIALLLLAAGVGIGRVVFSGTGVASPRPAPTVTVTATPVFYDAPTPRQFALVAKDPDSHAGEAYTIYGNVLKADPELVVASVGADRPTGSDPYFPQVAQLTGTEETLAPLVAGDLFKARVRVQGVFTETTAGGDQTGPAFLVDGVEVYGSNDKEK